MSALQPVSADAAGQPGILIIAIEQGRWGPARLPRECQKAGMRVAALCRADNALAATDYVDRCFELPVTRRAARLEHALVKAMRTWKPTLVTPADEQAVALLHWLVRRGARPGRLDDAAIAVITASLGTPEHFGAMLFKSETQALARRLGVLVPQGAVARDAAAALATARAIGFPVFAKRSFGWNGAGIVRYEDAAAVRAALHNRHRFRDRLAAPMRRWLGLDWYPGNGATEIQQAINGTPAMYAAVAWQGRMLAGFAGVPITTAGANGHATSFRLCPHAAMAAASSAMIEATGASGFIGFDFMVGAENGAAYLLECNPRPIQIGHLGPLVGVDLAAALASALKGETRANISASGIAEVSLFPQSRAPVGAGVLHDRPADDPPLLSFMLAAQVSAAGAGATRSR